MFEWREFPKLKTAIDLSNYITGREFNHGEYCHYTSVAATNGILKSRELRIGSVDDFNDEIDKDQYPESDHRLYYAFCFSTGVNENLALWYLYGGMSGTGTRLRWTKTRIEHLINSEYELRKVNDTDKSEVTIMLLQENLTMHRQFRDLVYYRTGKTGKSDLKYNTMTNDGFPTNEFHSYLESNKGFCKGIIWFYEKETRLQVELIGEAAEYVRAHHDDKFRVVLRIPDDVFQATKIDFAPEVVDPIIASEGYEAIRNHLITSSKVQLSAYHGTVKMKLCEKCERCCNNAMCKERNRDAASINNDIAAS